MKIDLKEYQNKAKKRHIYKTGDKKSIRAIPFFDAVIEGDDIWFSSNEFNGLFYGNLMSGETKRLTFFENEPVFSDWMHSSIIKVRDIIILFPFNTREIVICDLADNKIKDTYGLPEEIKLRDAPFCIRNILKDEESIYLFCENLILLRLDLRKGMIEKCGCISDEILRLGQQFPNYTTQQFIIERRIYSPIFNTNKVAIIDIENNKSYIKEIPIERVDGSCFDGKYIWICGADRMVICDDELNIIEELESIGVEENSKPFYQFAVPIGKEVAIFDNANKGIVYIDIEQERYRVQAIELNEQKKSRWRHCMMPLQTNPQYYLDLDDYSLKNIINDCSVRFMINFEEYLMNARKLDLKFLPRNGVLQEGVDCFYLEEFMECLK